MAKKPTEPTEITAAAAELLAQAKADYGTPQERKERSEDARAWSAAAVDHAAEAAGAWQGRK